MGVLQETVLSPGQGHVITIQGQVPALSEKNL